jgi:glycyl-tRNA synthetase beta chain
VPAEALESAIQGHQKCFPVMDSQGKLMPLFIAVSNIASKDMALVKQGNERVMRPRLSDSAFFWQQDRKQPLINQLERLKNVVFQAKLGSVYDKVVRVENLAVTLAKWLQVKEDFVRRAAQLAKCDLMTDMVGECPELEGTMGRYYALADGEPIEVAMAIEEHYQPRVAGGDLPAGDVGQVLAVADKLDTLASLFVLGKVPTGDKDPFALRRAALGVMRILVEKQLLVSLPQLITAAFSAFSLPSDLSQDDLVSRLHTFMLERLRGWLLDQDVSLEVFDAVQVCQNAEPYDMLQRMKAVDHFRQQPEAEQLTAANKRIHNILKKSAEGQSFDEVNADVLVDKAEKDLYQQAMALQETASCLLTARDYQPLLLLLAKLQPPIDAFFDQVMVMSDDPQLQQNRLALLSMIRQHFLQVADISLLS